MIDGFFKKISFFSPKKVEASDKVVLDFAELDTTISYEIETEGEVIGEICIAKTIDCHYNPNPDTICEFCKTRDCLETMAKKAKNYSKQK